MKEECQEKAIKVKGEYVLVSTLIDKFPLEDIIFELRVEFKKRWGRNPNHLIMSYDVSNKLREEIMLKSHYISWESNFADMMISIRWPYLSDEENFIDVA